MCLHVMERPESGSGHVSTFVLRDKFRCVERPESSTRHASTVVCRDKCRCTKMPESGSELETTCSCSGQADSGYVSADACREQRCILGVNVQLPSEANIRS